MEIKEIYSKIKSERNTVANIHREFELLPNIVETHFDFYQTIVLKDGPLSRGEREFLAVLTSESNSCEYCIEHHSSSLQKYSFQIPKERSLFFEDFAKTLTKEPYKCFKYREKANEIGITEEEFAHAVFIISYFNMANRLVYGMNIKLEDNFEESCH
tara:strand:+ start:32469 stop:32939 length:471 start_codon:yes stop_codon:yes gene_type:complete